MAKITLDICDYSHFTETCLEKFKVKEVECVHGWISSEVTIEGDRAVIEAYLHEEYLVGMDEEMKEEVLEGIEDE